MLNRSGVATLLIGFSCLFAACGDADDATEATTPTSTATTTPADGAATEPTATTDDDARSPTRTVEHVLGVAEVPVDPQRIVTLDSVGTLDGLVALGALDRIVGRVDLSGGDDPAWLDADWEAVPLLGTWPTLSSEAIVATDPALIVGWEVAVTQLDAALSQRTAVVATAATPASTNPRWQDSLNGLGMALGLESEAAALIDDYDAALADTVAALPDGFTGRPLTLLLGQGGMTGVGLGASAPPAEVLVELGLIVSPALEGQGDFVPISDELAGELDADIVMLLDFDQGATDWNAVLAELPTYGRLSAVAAGQVVVVDGSLWLNAGPIGARLLLDEIVAVLAP